MALKDYLGDQFLGVLASYQPQGIVHHICVVYPRRNNQLNLFIPKGHHLAVGSLVTLHLDNRTGVDELDAPLSTRLPPREPDSPEVRRSRG